MNDETASDTPGTGNIRDIGHEVEARAGRTRIVKTRIIGNRARKLSELAKIRAEQGTERQYLEPDSPWGKPTRWPEDRAAILQELEQEERKERERHVREAQEAAAASGGPGGPGSAGNAPGGPAGGTGARKGPGRGVRAPKTR